MIDTNFNDFTFKEYNIIIKKISESFNIINHLDLYYNFDHFHSSDRRYLILRHDVDFSVDRALEIAKIEAKYGVFSTYFFLFHSDFYNIFEKDSFNKIRQIIKMGHEIALHFDTIFYGVLDEIILEKMLIFERDILSNLFNVEIKVFSLHNPNPDIHNYNKYTLDELSKLYPQYFKDFIAGMVNTYGSIFRKIDYISDSNGFWRYRHINEIIYDEKVKIIQVLIYPEWWVKYPASPRKRVSNILKYRSKRIMKDYDNFLKLIKRENIR